MNFIPMENQLFDKLKVISFVELIIIKNFRNLKSTFYKRKFKV